MWLQQFKPGYAASPMFHYGGVPTNFRGNLEIPRRDLHNFQFTATVADPNFLDHEFDDYTVRTSRSLMCCRIVATIFTVLLLLRYTLPIIIYGAGEYSMKLFMLLVLQLLVLRTIGILLPICIMVKIFTSIQRRRHQQDPHSFSIATGSDEENELTESESQPQPHLIHVQ
ncbi:uncharacterized protein LOC132292645 isoform X1 [Cornus florida]|uniref:uncharacterized protein LOC132292645 isoform X1 n=1 Tax=Cornus florida TaxID=4283 RepID=UPI00289CEE69|nr:uncharacterized protein LOC132292645 isoform X1 [Cornus florida]